MGDVILPGNDDTARRLATTQASIDRAQFDDTIARATRLRARLAAYEAALAETDENVTALSHELQRNENVAEMYYPHYRDRARAALAHLRARAGRGAGR